MAAFNFPNSPSTNDLHTENGVTYKWNGTVWKRQNASYTDATNLNVTGISTFAGNINANGNIVGDNSTNISGINDVIATSLYTSDSIIHRGETADNTQIRFPADDTVTIQTNGSERLRIASDGNVTTTGTSTFSRTNAGFTARSGDSVSITRANGTPLEICRTTAQGNMINFVDTDGSTYRANIALSGNDLIFGLTGEKLRITSGGVLCVGAAAADGDEFLRVKNKLLVMNTANLGDAFVKIKAGESGGSVLEFEADEGDDYADLWRIQNAGDGLLGFRTKASGSWVEKLRITSSGELVFAADTDTFIDHPNANQIEITAGNIEVATFIDGQSNRPAMLIDKGGVNNTTGGDNYNSNANANDLVVGNVSSGNHGITVCSVSSGTGYINFSDGSGGGADAYRGSISYEHANSVTVVRAKTGNVVLRNDGTDTLVAGSSGEVSLRRGGISATPALEIYGSGNAGDATADNLRFQTWGNSSGDYWQIGVNSGLNSAGNNQKASNTLKGAAIRLNAKNGTVTLITSPASTSTTYEGLTQNEEGHVTIPQQPVFHVQLEGHKNADQNPLKFTDIRVNNGSHYNSSTGRFTAPTAGMYFFFMEGIKNSNSGSVTRVYIQKNGSYIYDSYHLRIQEEGYYADGCTNWIVSLAANDYITMRLQTGGLHAGEYTHFGGYLIG